MKIAVITGASSGMGREFVRQLDAAEVYDEIWVIARRRDRLEALAAHTSAVLRILPMDLTREESFARYKALLEAEKPTVAVLVNGSGFGRFCAFPDASPEEYGSMIDLNVKALVNMTYLTLPYMRAGGQIYQIGSRLAFQPVPYINVYGASKAFVLSFSRALNAELSGRGIRVMAVCPGWVRTEFFERAVKDDTITYYNRFYEADQVVKMARKDMKRGRDVSICGFPVKAQVFTAKLMPHKTVMRIWLKRQKKG